jgi:hypothetical protein
MRSPSPQPEKRAAAAALAVTLFLSFFGSPTGGPLGFLFRLVGTWFIASFALYPWVSGGRTHPSHKAIALGLMLGVVAGLGYGAIVGYVFRATCLGGLVGSAVGFLLAVTEAFPDFSEESLVGRVVRSVISPFVDDLAEEAPVSAADVAKPVAATELPPPWSHVASCASSVATALRTQVMPALTHASGSLGAQMRATHDAIASQSLPANDPPLVGKQFSASSESDLPLIGSAVKRRLASALSGIFGFVVGNLIVAVFLAGGDLVLQAFLPGRSFGCPLSNLLDLFFLGEVANVKNLNAGELFYARFLPPSVIVWPVVFAVHLLRASPAVECKSSNEIAYASALAGAVFAVTCHSIAAAFDLLASGSSGVGHASAAVVLAFCGLGAYAFLSPYLHDACSLWLEAVSGGTPTAASGSRVASRESAARTPESPSRSDMPMAESLEKSAVPHGVPQSRVRPNKQGNERIGIAADRPSHISNKGDVLMDSVPSEIALFLSEGEKIIAVMKGNSYTSSHNPLVRLIMFVLWIRDIVLGFTSRTTVICTDRRLLVESTSRVLFICERAKEVVSINPAAISSVGYQFLRMLLVVPSHGLSYEAGVDGERVIISREGREPVIALIKAIESLRAHAAART